MNYIFFFSSSFLLFLVNTSVYAQCNGSLDNCGKQYNEVAYLTTHNAYNTDSEGFSLPNQHLGIADQLNQGVRAFMLDVYDFFGTPTQYHGSALLGTQGLSSDLDEIKNFLDANSNEIVTLILECYVSADDIESELISTGLMPYVYTHLNGTAWPTLQEMINLNKRLVVFSDVADASPSQAWYHYVWDFAVETHYSVNNVNDFTDAYNRGDSLNDLYIFNHFVTNGVTGTGMDAESAIANEYNFLLNRIELNNLLKGKFPNFITVDFFELGNALDVVNTLNGGYLGLHHSIKHPEAVVGPNPANNVIQVNVPNNAPFSVVMSNLKGEIVFNKVNAVSGLKVNTSDLPSGLYLLKIKQKEGVSLKKIIVL
jgi:hypothetical protein